MAADLDSITQTQKENVDVVVAFHKELEWLIQNVLEYQKAAN